MSGLGWLAGGVATVLLLAGCSGEEPRAEPPRPSAPRTSPVATTSPSPTPPALPAAARENSKAGAVAFAHHYIDLINYARTSGDTDSLTRLSARTCVSCSAIVDIAEETYAQGGYLRGGDWTITGSSVLPASNSQGWQVVTSIKVSRQSYLPRAGASVQHRRSEKATLVFAVRRSQQLWSVTSLERQTND